MKSHWEMVLASQSSMTFSDTPESLWERAIMYFKWCDDNPINTKKTMSTGKKAGEKVEVEYVRPYTVKGLCLHCGIPEEYLMEYRRSADRSSLFYIVVSKIIYIIYTQNAEYAIIGEFNPVFTSKLLNLDKEEVASGPIRVEVVQGLPELSDSENAVLEKLELEIAEQKNDKRENY